MKIFINLFLLFFTVVWASFCGYLIVQGINNRLGLAIIGGICGIVLYLFYILDVSKILNDIK